MNITEIAAPVSMVTGSIQIINVADFLEFAFRFLLNTGVIFILVRLLYYRTTRRKDYLFTYILISTIVFLLCFLLESVKLQVGFALGLFAIFSIIRYRTNSIPIKEMTYLFLVIGISVINALTSTKTTLADLLFTNLVIIFITFGMERLWLLKHVSSKEIIYEKIDLIKPEKHKELLADLVERTGISNITRVETGRIDLQRDICVITIYYEASEPVNEEVNDKNENDDDD
jgi:hypothetical protein